MCGTSRQPLPLFNEQSGCACCSPQQQKAAVTGDVAPRTLRFQVAGMTCGHCVSAVSAELSKLDGVIRVETALVPHGRSTVTLSSAGVLDRDAIGMAVANAGYELAGIPSVPDRQGGPS
ncbi:heavy-metal-associated domain-containing protein [Arthrobacter sp. BL-252-APC-1A]|uniref:heavy-metal-associated domain-containing protein n=1 Tax=Arthrobacter sp. BL-252-APC-1A TaxID=2606622 RepID=UPI0012B35C42|nr:heavy-metal-associated domain-containing protein [Arthrobacter sp. BL-252-APC-1A]MSS00409.1 heavy-metal-associated domain-containing protein [Arthrobacter sp. BL-252-APC-1A]